MSYTPTPWRVSEICTLWGKNEEYIGDIADSIDAAHIVHCVNSHAALVEALRGVLHHNNGTKSQYQLPQSLLRHIENALAHAEKGARS